MSNNIPIPEKLASAAVEGPVKQSVGAVFDTLNKKVESLDLLGKYERTHKNHLRTALQNIKLLGMSSPIPLEKVYYPTLISTTIRRRLYEQEWLSGNSTKSKPAVSKDKNGKNTDACEYVGMHPKVVVLGGPGAGKTTFLRFLALINAGCIAGPAGHKKSFPFFVHLPHFAKVGKELFDFATDQLVKATDKFAIDFCARIFEKEDSLLLLDSLDEVPLHSRNEVITRIKAFEALYPNVRMVLSCRTADYEEVLQNFCEVEVARLGQPAMAKIIRAWFDTDQQKANQLFSLIQNDDGVAGLTETPLLLSLLCIQYRHDLQLPKRKTELYRRCLNALLRDWDSERGFTRETAYESMSDDRKERLFEHIAGKFFLEQDAYEFRKDQIISVVGEFIERIDIPASASGAIINEIERHHGIIEQFSQDFLCFSHTSMQDYFVARHLISRRIELDQISKNIENENWFPVIEFVLALAEEPDAILGFLIRKSDMKGLSNFPPMARRTKLLMLLHRGMLTAPFVTREVSKSCYEHLVMSQIQMAKIFQSGKVIPIAELGSFGVRHLLYHLNKPRPTLGDALGPYRKFSNQILSSPSVGYAEACLTAVDALRATSPGTGLNSLISDVLLVNLLMPIGLMRADDVTERLEFIAERSSFKFIKDIIGRSTSFIRSSHGKSK